MVVETVTVIKYDSNAGGEEVLSRSAVVGQTTPGKEGDVVVG
jgi:hypothetical protein